MIAVARFFILALFRLIAWLAYKGYRAEGINGLLLIMPAKLIAPTLRTHGARIGERVIVHSPLIVHNAGQEPGRHYERLEIGDRCYLGRDVLLDLKDRIVLESDVTISMRVTIITHTDVGESPLRTHHLPPSQAPIAIRTGAYVGAGATILQGVEIGKMAVIGAGAVVVDDVPAGTVAAGVPARVIRFLGDGGDSSCEERLSACSS